MKKLRPRLVLVTAIAVLGLVGVVWAFTRHLTIRSRPQTVAPPTAATDSLSELLRQPIPETSQDVRAEMELLAKWLKRSWPQRIEGLEIAARLMFHCGRLDEAEALWRQSLELDREFPFAHHGLGLVLAARGDYEGAIEHYRETLRLSPLAIEPTLELGDLLIKSGKIRQAIDLLENDFPASVESIWRYNMLGEAYLHEGELNRARLMYELALSLDPDDRTALNGLAVVNTRLGHQKEAKGYAARLKELQEVEREKRREERRAFDEGAHLARKLADAYSAVARVLTGEERLAEAEAAARRALALDPTHTDAHRLLALIRLRKAAGPAEPSAASPVRVSP